MHKTQSESIDLKSLDLDVDIVFYLLWLIIIQFLFINLDQTSSPFHMYKQEV